MQISVISQFMSGHMGVVGIMVKEVEYQVTTGNYLTKITISILTLISIAGCIKNVDVITSFNISGRVIESDKGIPVKNTQIVFIDRGFDYVRSRHPDKYSHEIGSSNAEGVFDIVFEYWWGYQYVFSKPKPRKTFDLVFRKEGYKDKNISYDSKILPVENRVIHVEVGTVILYPE